MQKITKLIYGCSYDSKFKSCLASIEKKYGFNFFQFSGIGKQLDPNWYAKNWFKEDKNTADVSVDSNSNVGLKNTVVYDIEMSKPNKLMQSYYRMWKGLKKTYGLDYANQAVEKQISGEIYVNDFHGFASNLSYCFAYSTLDTALKGIPKEIDGEGATPAKYLGTFLEHLQLFCVHAGSSTLGAVGIPDLLLTVSCYVNKILKTGYEQHNPMGVSQTLRNFLEAHGYKDYCRNLGEEYNVLSTEEACYTYVREKLTNFVWFLNQPNRVVQSLFTNVSIYDDIFLKQHIDNYQILVDDEVYEADTEIVKKLQVMFLEILNEENKRRLMTFPVISMCFAQDEEGNVIQEDLMDKFCELNSEMCSFNFFSGDTSTTSSCCRLRMEGNNKYFTSLGSGSSVKIGSLGVCTLNYPRIAYLAQGNKSKFFKRLNENIILAQRINHIKRNILKNAIRKKMLPIYNQGYLPLQKQFSTLGINGIYEALEIMGYDITTEEGLVFEEQLQKFVNAINNKLSDEFKAPLNIEMIPAENVSVKLSTKDRMLGYNTKYEIYSNQFIPLVNEASILDRIRIQGRLDATFGGGSILHVNVDEDVINPKIMAEMAKVIIKAGVRSFGFNKLIATCDDCGATAPTSKDALDNKTYICKKCGSKNISYAIRVVGFIRKIKSFSEARRKEAIQRKFYKSF